MVRKTTFALLLLLAFFLFTSCTPVQSDTPLPQVITISRQTATPPSATLTPLVFTATSSHTEEPVWYTVVEGDSLWSIARSFGVTIEALAAKNALIDPNNIFPGQVLLIPDQTEAIPVMEVTNKRILVILSQQMVYAYEGETLVADFLVSTGVAEHPTVTGTFYIYSKLELALMTGEDYYLPDVPWTMYFYQGYSFHGTYWHHNFGTPMSHGCINMFTPDAEWLYYWAPFGTKVTVVP